MGGSGLSQQLDRAGVRPAESGGLLSYTGQVMLVGDPEIGSTGKERPRKVVISDNPGQYQGKTFRCWSWKPDFEAFEVGRWVTVGYEVEPNPDPTRHGSNMISVAETTTAPGGGGGQPQKGPSAGEGPQAGRSPSPQPTPRVVNDYDETTLQIESAWAIKAVLDRQDPGEPMKPDEVIEKALQLVILKRRLASELGDG